MLPALFLSLAGMGGCGGGTSGVVAQDAAPVEDAAVIGMIVKGSSQPCTEAHSVCMNAKFAASMTAAPTKILVGFFKDFPPTNRADGISVSIDNPDLAAGETVQLRMTDQGLTGTYYILGVVFMPGGGYAIPVPGVDYSGIVTTTYALTGAPVNASDTLDFQLAQ
jgi:hypothetical protein